MTSAMVSTYLQRSLDALDRVTADMSVADLSRHPEGRWSAALILEHLARSYGSTAHILEKCVADGAPKGRAQSVRERGFTFIVVTLGYMPTGVKAPAVTEPQGLPTEDVLDAARDALRALDVAAARCADRFGTRVRVANHPLLGGFTVAQWRRFHWVHTRHHVRQIRARDRQARRANPAGTEART